MKNTKIYIAGHEGMVGSSILEELISKKYTNIIYEIRANLDLTRQLDVEEYIKKNKPDVVVIAAARVGGIKVNDEYAAEFIYQNMMIAINIINACFQNNIKNIIFLGSSCIYPKYSQQPVLENDLLNGKVEPTNEAYAIAKISGIKLCQFYNKQYGTNYISLMPTNTYGPGDNFDLNEGHVIPSLINKFHNAKENSISSVEVWGSGKQSREFIFVKDIASSVRFILEKMINNEEILLSESNTINIGTAEEITIRELSNLISEVVGYKGIISFDKSKPDGTPRRILDSQLIRKIGWKPQTTLRAGLDLTYKWYLDFVKSSDIK